MFQATCYSYKAKGVQKDKILSNSLQLCPIFRLKKNLKK
jgi:hypothetical protein